MRSRSIIVAGLIAVGLSLTALGAPAQADEQRPPNIVYIYADDLGYGDIGCYGATKVETPNLDQLASQGLRFTDAHAPAATCTPSRYALLTGEYAWRKPGTGILPGDAAMIIEPGRPTLPAILKEAGYTTGVVGKWHLGLGDGQLDWNGPIQPGPLEIGFDHAFIMPATGDRVPCVYVENHRIVGLNPADPIQVDYKEPVGDEPTGKDHPEYLKMKLSKGHDQTIVNGISRIGYMAGGHSARWVDESMADMLTKQAVGFIERNKDQPFFLYFPTHDVHVPRVPNPRFVGKSGCGVRGDVIAELDWCVGEVMATIDRLGLTDSTLFIFTSDNGPVVDDGYADGAVEDLNGHQPAGPLRGTKYSTYEGGTRVPFIAAWPGRIKPGVSNALFSQIDLLASFAKLAGQDLPEGAGPDSQDHLAVLLGDSQEGREVLVEQGGGTAVALRDGPWKYIPPRARPRAGKNAPRPPGELFNLKEDLAETNDLAKKHPDRVAAMRRKLDQIREQGHDQLAD